MKYYYNLKSLFSIGMYVKMCFILASLLQPSVTWSFRNHFNMLICCSRNISDQWRLVQKKFGGAQTNWKYGRSGPSSLILFFLHPNALWTGIFVKIKPNVLSSGDIALASTLISTCLSTDELLLSGTRVVENGPITWGQTYENNIDSL